MKIRRIYWALPIILLSMLGAWFLRKSQVHENLFSSSSPVRCLTTDFDYNATSGSTSNSIATLPSLNLRISMTPIHLLDGTIGKTVVTRFQFADGQSIFLAADQETQVIRSFMTPRFDSAGFPLAIEVAGRFPIGSSSSIESFEYRILGNEKLSKDLRSFHADSIKGNLNQALAFRLLDGTRDAVLENGKIKSVKGAYRLIANNGSRDIWEYRFQYSKIRELSSSPSDCTYASLSALVRAEALQEVDFESLRLKLYNQAKRDSFDAGFDAKGKLAEALRLNEDRGSNHDRILKLFSELSQYYDAFPERLVDLFPLWDSALKNRPFNRAKSLFLFDLIDNRDDPAIQEWAMAQFDSPALKDDAKFREHIIANMNFGKTPSDKVFERLKELLHETPEDDGLRSTLLLALASYGARSETYRNEAMDHVQSAYQEASTPAERNLAIGAAGNLGTIAAKALIIQALSNPDESDQSAAIAALARIPQTESVLFDYARRSHSTLGLRRDALQTLCRLDQPQDDENSFRAMLEGYYLQSSFAEDQPALSKVFFDCLRSRGDPLSKADADRRFIAKIKAMRPLRPWERA